MLGEGGVIGAGRGQRWAMPVVVAGERAERNAWLLCRAGTMSCALPIEHVVEVMRALPVEQFAGAPKFVLGLSVIRGLPVPVVDLGLVVCGASIRGGLLVTVREGSRTIALAVDQVIGVTALEAETFSQLPPLLHEAAADTIAAIAALDGEFVVLLRAARLVPEDVLAWLDAEKAKS
jgi:purine-binding chemotaxis protein CheW